MSRFRALSQPSPHLCGILASWAGICLPTPTVSRKSLPKGGPAKQRSYRGAGAPGRALPRGSPAPSSAGEWLASFVPWRMKAWGATDLVPGLGLKSHATLFWSCGPEASLLSGQPAPQGRELTPELTQWTVESCSCPLPNPSHALTSTHPFFHPSTVPSPSTSSATPCLSVFPFTHSNSDLTHHHCPSVCLSTR